MRLCEGSGEQERVSVLHGHVTHDPLRTRALGRHPIHLTVTMIHADIHVHFPGLGHVPFQDQGHDRFLDPPLIQDHVQDLDLILAQDHDQDQGPPWTTVGDLGPIHVHCLGPHKELVDHLVGD